MNIWVTFVKLEMATISSISASQSTGATTSLQTALQQAKRTADQAESNAKALEAQANQAQNAASSAQDYANSLSTQAGQAQLNVGWTQQNLAAVETVGQLSSQISSVITNVVDAQQSKVSNTAASIPNAPVVNTQGQITGKIINTSA